MELRKDFLWAGQPLPTSMKAAIWKAEKAFPLPMWKEAQDTA